MVRCDPSVRRSTCNRSALSSFMYGMTQQLLSITEVAKRLSISRRTAFALAKTKDFPAPIRLSARCVRYSESALNAWIASRVLEG